MRTHLLLLLGGRPEAIKLFPMIRGLKSEKGVGANHDRIVDETFRLLDDDECYAAMARTHNPFGDGAASERIVKVLLDA